MTPDTFFSADPHWSWFVIGYFFLGGIAGGSYFIAAMLDLFGDRHDRPLSRLGYYVTFPILLACAVLLILDLNRPEAFWHMMLQSQQLPLPIFKYWSPMSLGTWVLLIFGAFSFASFMGSLAEDGRLRWGLATRLNDFVRHGRLGGLFALVGSAFGFILASYTGVLASVTNRPLWADNSVLGLLFLTSAASTAAALLLFLAHRSRAVLGESVHWLLQMDNWAMVMELVALGLLVATLGPVAQILLSVWGVLLAGVVLLGILLPLLLRWRPLIGAGSMPTAALLVLVGGFALRAVIVLASQMS